MKDRIPSMDQIPVVMKPLPESFYTRDTIEVARGLIGKTLVRQDGKVRISGMIIETEAYRGEEDLACHCRAGRTPRTEIMYGPAGRAYVYLIYGMYWLFNIVTEKTGNPGAVLIRAVEPLEGLDLIAERRKGHPRKNWTDGPGKLSRALNILGDLNGSIIYSTKGPLFIAQGKNIPSEVIQTGPRVGLDSVPEPWRSIPWRFRVPISVLNDI
jgi:DNA-3-methyladenine glycosylase